MPTEEEQNAPNADSEERQEHDEGRELHFELLAEMRLP